MSDQSYTVSITVPQAPEAVYAAILNARAWWSDTLTGDTGTVGAILDYHYQDMHRCKLQVTEAIPGKAVVWHVLENYFGFTKNPAEWTGTDLVFAIEATPEGTLLTFTHVGLVPDEECYETCEDAWNEAIQGSLRQLITTGHGTANVG